MTSVLTPPVSMVRSVDDRRRLVVIGNGMAGARTVEEILARDGADQFAITMFGDEPYGNYNRIKLSQLLSGEEVEDEIYLNTRDWYEANDITFHAGVRAVRIDRDARTVHGDDGTLAPYDELIIATGSRSFLPPIDGLHGRDGRLLNGVFAFRTLDDTREMIRFAAHDHHVKAIVIGGGLLGLEAARGLQRFGMSVDVVHRAGHLMEAQVGPLAGDTIRRRIEDLGIAVHTNASTAEVLGQHTFVTRKRVSGIKLSSGLRLDCDMLVVAAGIRPNVDLARESGLTVDRAIVVDDQLRTVEDPHIRAVGECAQHRGQVYGLVAPLWEQAVVLADHLTGHAPAAAYEGSQIATKLKVAGVDVAAMGVQGPELEGDEHVVYAEPHRGIHTSVVIRDDRVIGATLVGDTRKVAFLTQAFDRGLPLPENRAELLFDLGGGSGEMSVEEMPDDTQVCNCNGVSKGRLVQAVHDGCTSVKSVMDATRAAKGCGSCKNTVCAIVELAAGGAMTEDPSAHWYVPGIPLDKPALMAAIRDQHLTSVSSVFAALAPGGAEDAKSKMGLASLLRMMWGPDYVDERDARFINDRVHANIQHDGTFSVVPQIAGGVTNPEQLRRIADVAEKYAVPMIKVTGGQRIDLLGVRKEDLPKVWADLDMPSGYAYGKSMRTVKTCVGQDFCRFGLGDSTTLGVEMEQRFSGMESPAKMKLAVSGCPRNCAESYVKDVGIVAIGNDRWEIYVGGAAGATIRKGDLLVTVEGAEQAKLISGRFLQYYRENAKWLERTYDFVPRVGLETIRAVVVDDSEGIAEQLDAAVQHHADNHLDPWLDRDAPTAEDRFRTSLPLEVLPRVGRSA